MRSAWMDQLFHRRRAGGHGPARTVASAPLGRHRAGTDRGVRNVTAAPTSASAPKKSARLCLGIGDGSLRTQ